MVLKKLELVLLALSFCNNEVIGVNDCTPPWVAENSPFFASIKSNILYRCPSIFGDPKKEYCCYNSNGDVECCNYFDYLIFQFVCLLPIFLIIIIVLSIISCICFLCPFCVIYKYRQSRCNG